MFDGHTCATDAAVAVGAEPRGRRRSDRCRTFVVQGFDDAGGVLRPTVPGDHQGVTTGPQAAGLAMPSTSVGTEGRTLFLWRDRLAVGKQSDGRSVSGQGHHSAVRSSPSYLGVTVAVWTVVGDDCSTCRGTTKGSVHNQLPLSWADSALPA